MTLAANKLIVKGLVTIMILIMMQVSVKLVLRLQMEMAHHFFRATEMKKSHAIIKPSSPATS